MAMLVGRESRDASEGDRTTGWRAGIPGGFFCNPCVEAVTSTSGKPKSQHDGKECSVSSVGNPPLISRLTSIAIRVAKSYCSRCRRARLVRPHGFCSVSSLSLSWSPHPTSPIATGVSCGATKSCLAWQILHSRCNRSSHSASLPTEKTSCRGCISH
jgi:hypothetical protein